MNIAGLGGGINKGSGLGRRLDFLASSSFSPSVPPFCSELSDNEFRSERLRVTMTEGLWSARGS